VSAARVTLTACVAGNPLKAWRDGTDPDDVWQDQSHDFDDVEAAKAFVRGLHPDTTTHVVLYGTDDDGEHVLYRKDHGEDDLDAAGVGVVPPSEQPPVPDDVDETPPAPPLMPAQ